MKRVATMLVLGLLASGGGWAGERPVVAVFDIEDTREKKEQLPPEKLRSLTDYLANKLAIGGRFKIVPRASVRAAIQAKKAESYKECYDEACQIEVGKEIAAEKSLATKIDQLGEECIVTSTLFDLRQSATENSASYRGPCGRSELLTAVEQIAARLRGETGAGASKAGIRFDTSDLPAVPTLDLPEDSGRAASGVDFGDVDVDALELFDAAVQGEKDEGVSIPQKIARWQEVQNKAPKYRAHASGRIVAWQEHARKKQQIEVIQKKRAARMMEDWAKLSRLLKLKMISAEDREAWSEAFYSAYEVEARENPFARDPAAVEFLTAMTEKKRKAEEESKRVEEEKSRAEEARLRAGEEEKWRAEEARRRGETVWAGLPRVFSRPAGIEFTKSEITVAQYRACVKAGECRVPADTGLHCNWDEADREQHPINCVDWNQATAFCAWVGGRLPTEEEWYAEGSDGGKRKYPWGDEEPSCERAIFWEGLEDREGSLGGCGKSSTWPVCSRPAGNSVSGLCDLSGNVWEWTSSAEGSSARVVRGASYLVGSPVILRATFRNSHDPSYQYCELGFRCVRSPR